MRTIDIDSANGQFHGTIVVGQYVAYWTSDDTSDSLPMTIGSYATPEAAIKAAEAEAVNAGLSGGRCHAHVVTD
jgi:hypothetical protein